MKIIFASTLRNKVTHSHHPTLQFCKADKVRTDKALLCCLRRHRDMIEKLNVDRQDDRKPPASRYSCEREHALTAAADGKALRRLGALRWRQPRGRDQR